jgi:hypothetical protein
MDEAGVGVARQAPAEGYPQGYYKKTAVRYQYYDTGCGRYARLDELWGKLRK